METREFSRVLKFVIIGESGTGKTCILKRFTEDKYNENTLHTIGAEFGSKVICVHDNLVKVQIWDTAGQERFRSMTQSYYRDALGILLVYDISNRDSFNCISDWLTSIENVTENEVEIMLIGNKIDLEETSREVLYDEGQQFAVENNLKFMETSAKTGDHVEEVFIDCTSNILTKIRNGQLDMDRIRSSELRNVSLEKPISCSQTQNSGLFDKYIMNSTISTNNLSKCCNF